MITKATGYKASDGVVYATIEEAQASEMRHLLNVIDGTGLIGRDNVHDVLDMMAADLVKHTDELLAILTTGPRSRPSTRKKAGTTNPKRATQATPKQAKAGFKAMREAVDQSAAQGTDVPADPSMQQSESAAA